MGWILFINEDNKPCAWPDESTMVKMSKNEEVILACGKNKSLPAERPQHTNDWEQVLLWVEGDDGEVVQEPGFEDFEGDE